MNFLASSNQTLQEILTPEFENTFLAIAAFTFIFLILVSAASPFWTSTKITSWIFGVICAISVVILTVSCIFAFSTGKKNDEKIDELSSIISDSLHDKYDFKDFSVIKVNDEKPHLLDSFEFQVFSKDIIDSPSVNVLLNDGSRVTWGVTGDPKTGEIEFVGNGDTNPEDILKESE